MSHKYSFKNFRVDLKALLNQIFEEEESLIPIHIDNVEVQNLIEQYDEDFPQALITIAEGEINNFINQKS